MKLKADIYQDLDLTLTAHDVAQTYEEIAASKVLTSRASVAQTREFLDQVDKVYHDVHNSYVKWLQYQRSKGSKKKKGQVKALTKNGKIAMILISASRGLYGDLPMRIVTAFTQSYRAYLSKPGAKPVDVVVIGSVGEYLLDNPVDSGQKIPYQAFKIDDNTPKEEEFAAVIEYIKKYDGVTITYGKYQSLLSLVPETVDISGGDFTTVLPNKPQTAAEVKAAEGDPILFEPSVEVVAEFFETEILKALFRQKVFEMQLARYASRMTAMDNATERANERVESINKEMRRLKKRIANKKLQQIFAGSMIWEDRDNLMIDEN